MGWIGGGGVCAGDEVGGAELRNREGGGEVWVLKMGVRRRRGQRGDSKGRRNWRTKGRGGRE